MNEIRVLSVALVVLAAGAAWSSFKGEVVVQPLEPLLSLEASRVEGLVYRTATSTVVAERRGDHWWMTVDRKAVSRSFVASPQLDGMLEAMLPMRPLRSLGRLDQAKLEDFGLRPPRVVLELQGPAGKRRVHVGERTQTGQSDGYGQRPDEEEVFVLDLSQVDRLDNAAAFRQRRLRNQDRGEVAAARVQWAEGEARARQRNRQSPKKRFWAAEAEPDSRDEALEAFLDEVERLRIQSFPEPAPELDPSDAMFTVTWLDAEDEVLDEMRLWAPPEGERERWLVESTASKRAGQVVKAAGRDLRERLDELEPD